MSNIILAFSDYETGIKIRTILSSYGLVTNAIASTLTQVSGYARRFQEPGVVICQKDFRDGICTQLKDRLPPNYQIVALVKNTPSDTDMFEGITTLTLPLNKKDLIDTVRMLEELGQKNTVSSDQKQEKESSKKNKFKPQRTPQEEKVINEAKALLMERNNFTEQQAHRFIQKKSMDSGIKFSAAALSILERW